MNFDQAKTILAANGFDDWVKATDRLPPDETSVYVIRKGKQSIGELRWETPTHEETFKAFRYWAHPDDDWVEELPGEVTHWRHMHKMPADLVPVPEVQEATMQEWTDSQMGGLG